MRRAELIVDQLHSVSNKLAQGELALKTLAFPLWSCPGTNVLPLSQAEFNEKAVNKIPVALNALTAAKGSSRAINQELLSGKRQLIINLSVL